MRDQARPHSTSLLDKGWRITSTLAYAYNTLKQYLKFSIFTKYLNPRKHYNLVSWILWKFINKICLNELKYLSANPTKWSNTLGQFVGNLPTNCLSEFDHFVGLALKRLRYWNNFKITNFHFKLLDFWTITSITPDWGNGFNLSHWYEFVQC